ncbi:MAG: GH92 family glycosyl hydrolase [Bacteroidales bacterium]|nr:GH92 family glycosyl hydrolase [Bacteroidales bacterium]
MNRLFPHMLLAAFLLAACSSPPDPLREVNVFNGTAAAGNTYPGATVPYGAVQLSPDTDAGLVSGYHYDHNTIMGFSHTHLSGTGCPDFGDFQVMPGLNEVKPMGFTHDNEEASPGYYKVQLESVVAELTAWEHTGYHRYTFKVPGKRMIMVDATYCQGGWCTPTQVSLRAEGQEVLGHRRVNGWAIDRDIYLSAEFSVPFVSAREVEPGKMLFTFPDEVVEVCLTAGLSGTGEEGARKNRQAEAMGFDEARARAEARWAQALGTIQVKGGPTDVFYTYFYHTFQTPNLIDDVGGLYRNQRGRNVKLEGVDHFYSTLSVWDTFRTWHPLQTILNPQRTGDIVNSLLDDYDCLGELPIWPLASFETACMIGYHPVSVIADAWLRGIRTFDGERALKAMIATSNKHNVNASQLYNQYGWIPADLKIETVSQTLEFAYDDWCIARMAESLGYHDVAGEYDSRSLRYRELFEPVTGFMRGKNADGSWVRDFDPLKGSRDYTEATPWQYRFFVPHDMSGLAALMGGEEPLLQALDSLFTFTPEDQASVHQDIGGVVGQYAQGNEPDHNFPWLFYWTPEASRSQQVVRQVLTETYSAAPDGISGNEDCGQMSAWYVMASIGLYPVCPGSGQYLMTAPLFKETVIRLGNGKTLTIKADKPKYPYISKVFLNGEPVEEHYLTYDQIMQGGVLSFRLSRKPSSERDALPHPYSLTEDPPVCPPSIQGQLFLFKDETQVSLGCKTPGASIHYTLDGSEPTEESPLYEEPFTISESGPIRARAFRKGMPPSPYVSQTAHKLYFHPSADREDLKPGCRYTYHEANFTILSQIESDPPEGSGVMLEPSIAGTRREDHFAYTFFGYIDIPITGIWTFETRSDDGSALYIDGVRVVNNDGSHSEISAYGEIPLEKGLHPFKILYFEDYEGEAFSWYWCAPGTDEFKSIPPACFYHK